MKILMITNGIGYGGVEKNVFFLANNFCVLGHSVIIVSISTESKYEKDFKQTHSKGIKLVQIAGNKTGLFRHIYRMAKLLSIIVHNKIDIVIGFTLFPNFYASIISKLTKIPSVITERGNPFALNNTGLKNKVMFAVINKSTGAVFQTKGASKFYDKKLQRRCAIIPNSIENKDNSFVTKRIVKRQKSIVSIGRLQNNPKRYDLLLDAFYIVHKSFPQYSLKIFGSGPSENSIKKQIANLNLENAVTLMGSVKEPYLQILDEAIYVITSDSEGIPNSLLEAMSVGLPVVATDCEPGGARLIISNRKNGLLVEKGSAKAIANAIMEYIKNPDLADSCSFEARKVLETFAPSQIIKKWIYYLNSLIYNDK